MSERPFTNDPSIANGEVLLRRLQPDWIVPGNHGLMRIASAAFKHQELSILFYTLLRSQGRPVQDALSGRRDNSLCSITAGLARDLGQGVVYDLDPPNDPCHGLIVGRRRSQ
jgi:hypothetical protein